MKLYAENLLIGNQWQTDRTLTIDADGTITAITKGGDPEASAVSGPLIPGMVNCHSHAFQRAFAGFSEYRGSDQDSFWSWRDIMYRFVAQMTPQDVHTVAKYLYLEMLQAGYTCVAEFHYLHHQVGGKFYDDPAEMSHQVINAAFETGISIAHLPVLYTHAGFNQQKPAKSQMRFIHQTDEYCQLLQNLWAEYSQHKRFSLGIAPHSLRAVDAQQLKQIIPVIRKLDQHAPIHIHIAEQMQEVNDCKRYYGLRPVEWLLRNHSHGEFKIDRNWCLIHATHLTQDEISRLARSGAVVGICPTTEANLGDGIFPTAEYLFRGGRFAIGSDSHIAVNLADELRTLEYGQRLTKHQRAVLVGQDCPSVGQYLYTQAAQHGASTVNQNIGEIAVGKRADFVVLDSEHPTLFAKPNNRILDAAIFGCDSLPVKDVMIAGQYVIKDGIHGGGEQIALDYRKVMKKLSEQC